MVVDAIQLAGDNVTIAVLGHPVILLTIRDSTCITLVP